MEINRMETCDDLAAELAQALSMLFNVATDEKTRLAHRGDLYTDMALNLPRETLIKATASGLLPPST